MRLTVCALVAAASVAAPAAASAAEFQAADLPCALSGGAVPLTGTGWTPGATWTLSGGIDATVPVDAGGAIATTVMAPTLPVKRRTPQTLTLSATDGTQTATTELPVVNAGAIWSSNGQPRDKVRWSFGGLVTGDPVYVHVRRGAKTIKTTRVGRAAGPCGTASKKLRRLPVRPSQVQDGTYKIHVDNRRRFVAAAEHYTYTYRVTTTLRMP